MKTWIDKLKKKHACADAVVWASQFPTCQAALIKLWREECDQAMIAAARKPLIEALEMAIGLIRLSHGGAGWELYNENALGMQIINKVLAEARGEQP